MSARDDGRASGSAKPAESLNSSASDEVYMFLAGYDAGKQNADVNEAFDRWRALRCASDPRALETDDNKTLGTEPHPGCERHGAGEATADECGNRGPEGAQERGDITTAPTPKEHAPVRGPKEAGTSLRTSEPINVEGIFGRARKPFTNVIDEADNALNVPRSSEAQSRILKDYAPTFERLASGDVPNEVEEARNEAAACRRAYLHEKKRAADAIQWLKAYEPGPASRLEAQEYKGAADVPRRERDQQKTSEHVPKETELEAAAESSTSLGAKGQVHPARVVGRNEAARETLVTAGETALFSADKAGSERCPHCNGALP